MVDGLRKGHGDGGELRRRAVYVEALRGRAGMSGHFKRSRQLRRVRGVSKERECVICRIKKVRDGIF